MSAVPPAAGAPVSGGPEGAGAGAAPGGQCRDGDIATFIGSYYCLREKGHAGGHYYLPEYGDIVLKYEAEVARLTAELADSRFAVELTLAKVDELTAELARERCVKCGQPFPMHDAKDRVCPVYVLERRLAEVEAEMARERRLLVLWTAAVAHHGRCRVVVSGGCDCGAWQEINALRGETLALIRGAPAEGGARRADPHDPGQGPARSAGETPA